jgi:DNA-directed RNA polymerase specialized sigma24 family protein
MPTRKRLPSPEPSRGLLIAQHQGYGAETQLGIEAVQLLLEQTPPNSRDPYLLASYLQLPSVIRLTSVILGKYVVNHPLQRIGLWTQGGTEAYRELGPAALEGMYRALLTYEAGPQSLKRWAHLIVPHCISDEWRKWRRWDGQGHRADRTDESPRTVSLDRYLDLYEALRLRLEQELPIRALWEKAAVVSKFGFEALEEISRVPCKLQERVALLLVHVEGFSPRMIAEEGLMENRRGVRSITSKPLIYKYLHGGERAIRECWIRDYKAGVIDPGTKLYWMLNLELEAPGANVYPLYRGQSEQVLSHSQAQTGAK